jgi:hypothetical protein
VATVNDFDKITCRLAIQVRIGYFPDGRERHRTFSIKNIAPNAEVSALCALVRAIAPLLAHPITKVRLVTKKFRALSNSLTENAPAPVIESRVINLAEPDKPAPAPRKEPAKPVKPVPEHYMLVLSLCALFSLLKHSALLARRRE